MRIRANRPGLLLLLLSGIGAPTIAETRDLETLRQGLSFHCSFDTSADADFARGDRRVHTLLRMTPLKTRPGLWTKHVVMEETAGRYGGAIRFNRPSQQTLLYRDAISVVTNGPTLSSRSRASTGTAGRGSPVSTSMANSRGRSAGNSHNYIGLIDDFAVFDRALSAAEIKTLYALPAGVTGLRPATPSPETTTPGDAPRPR